MKKSSLPLSVILCIVLLNTSCRDRSSHTFTDATNQQQAFSALSWEKNHSERIAWSQYTLHVIDSLFDNSFSLCEDIKDFRSDYDGLTRSQKINVWGELVSAIAKYESGWKPNSWMKENMGIDPVTKRQVRSEGLLQLSYQDKLSYPGLPCKFDWKLDENLGDDDLNKTIFSPEYNLEFGINILAKQIREQKRIALTKNVYWAVLKINGQYSQIPGITKMVNAIKL